MLQVAGIIKRFSGGKLPALSDVSFSVNRGEAVALVGENGAGKSTLVRIISSILKPDEGTITIDGINPEKSPHLTRGKTGTLFSGDGALYDRLTAKENITYHAKINGIADTEYSVRLRMLTDSLDLDDFLDRRVSTFSRGMKQRTAIARTLITGPELVILDEPSTGLDITACGSVKKIISQLKNENRAVLFASHSPDEIFSSADRIIVIHKGRINCDQTIEKYSSLYGRDLSVFIREHK